MKQEEEIMKAKIVEAEKSKTYIQFFNPYS